jgi:Flp pilus assembly pilin Flp
MGFFKKIFKGIKKVFKKIGKAIKSAFKKVGKFMGKIGIVGQLGLALIMPYALPALGGLATGMMGTQLGGALGAVVKGAGHFLNAAVKVGTRVGQAFKSVTSAVTKTIGNMVGATINSIPGGKAFGGFMKELTGGMIDITGKNFSNAWDATQKAWSQAGSDLGQLFSKSTIDSSMNKFGIQANLEKTVGGEFDTSNISYDPVTNKTSIGVDRATGTLGNQGVGLDVADSLGLGTPGTTYSASGLPLGTDEALFTVGGTPSTYQAPSLLDVPTTSVSDTLALETLKPESYGVSLDASVKNIARQPQVTTEFDGFTDMSGSVPAVQKSLAARAGETGRKFLKEQGYEMSLMGAAKVVDEFTAAREQQEFMQQTKDPFAFVDMSYLTPQPIQSSPGLSTSGLTPMAGFDYFNQIQDDILNSNFTNMYSQGYYGAPSLQAGLAMAYEELAA